MSDVISEHPFHVVDIPGKGKGVVASRDISRGDLVLAEAPIFTQPGFRTNSSIGKALLSLPDKDKLGFLSLFNSKPDGSGEGLLKDIFDTNAFGLGSTVPFAGIFLTGSRFNHSCTPNVHRHFFVGTGKLRFHAISDIKAGDELCIAYFDIDVPSSIRQARFKNGFNCACSCDTCTLPAGELKKSDDRRAAKAELDGIITANAHAPRTPMRAILRVLEGLKLDGVAEGVPEVCYLAFQVCVVAHDATSAKIWAQRFMDLETVMCGSAHDERVCAKLSNLIEDPRRHPAWGLGTKTNLLKLTQLWKM